MKSLLKNTIKKLEKVAKLEGVSVYAVGGFVRDKFLGKEDFKDVDFVVEGSGIDFAKKFDKEINKSVRKSEENTGKLIEFSNFDTARYLFVDRENDNKVLLEFEFAGARTESYEKNSRKPKIKSVNLKEDLSRRDFTINALALPVDKIFNKNWKKFVIDEFGGLYDLSDRILRTPLEPKATFSDDPLRMLRAIRFASQLNCVIEEKTLKAIYTEKKRIEIVSAERIKEELFKLLSTPQPSLGLVLMFQTGLLDLILPEVVALDGVEEIYGHNHKNNLVHTFKVVDNIAGRTDKILLRFAGLLHDIGKSGTKKFVKGTGWTFHGHEHLGKKMVKEISQRLKLSKDEYLYLAKMVRWHQQPISLMDEGVTDSAVRRLIVNLGDDLEDLLILGVSDITTGNPYKLKKRQTNYDYLRAKIAEVIEKDNLRAFQSPVRGEEIMRECGLKPGPTVGKIKSEIEEAILDCKIPNEYVAAKKYFEKIKPNFMKNVQEWEKIN